jgi:RNA polymerase sigma-70 factor (ECF subfamily)
MELHQQSPRGPATWDAPWPQTLDEFQRLVETLQDRLVRYAFRRLGSLHEAEDAVQQVLVQAYANGRKGKKVTHVNAYLYRMLRNRCSDLLRKRKGQSIVLAQSEASEFPASQPDALQATAAVEELRRIEDLLGHIPPRQAEVVRFRVLDELRLAEIANVLGCPLATVKSRLRYGLEKLREIILRERKVL